jgi:hypothetical protein
MWLACAVHIETAKETNMKNTRNNYQPAKSLYIMLAKSDHEERTAYEGAVYMLFMLSALFSIWQVISL